MTRTLNKPASSASPFQLFHDGEEIRRFDDLAKERSVALQLPGFWVIKRFGRQVAAKPY